MKRDKKAESLLYVYCVLWEEGWHKHGNREREFKVLAETLGYEIWEDCDEGELWHISKNGRIVCSKFTTDEECTYEYNLDYLEEKELERL